ncbi:hypothetical protein [Agrobacterium tumefaciens]|uniref:Uncharacterized protein n=1 Tax=Agrobacterium tumefaciens TaxID=358 RepID=A0AA44F720_AGRTU|nr:hypothetical protein [Agrobacterium tumefaciens]NSL25117.1 hypothetical protein [Agrobacterium tumefaciens]NTB86770.1 hypothetical protein [Agrobacterium tumefaciens]NTC21099.1 hypothetical protein [Agrobacterium tumefaciens]NTC30647.1 hypothetical protein [Agrobacterium tumefaciens]NTC57691.1 hypothetical protein [Agrobacterium tumefaciens]
MDLQAELDRLRERVATLGETIQDMDYQMERAMHAVALGTDDVGHAMTVLSERHNAQLGLMFDLGKLRAQIEDLENRLREQDERPLEQTSMEEWDGLVSPVEDRLDWLHLPVAGAGSDNSQRHSHDEGEPRTRGDVPRERQEQEDYLDWGKR